MAGDQHAAAPIADQRRNSVSSDRIEVIGRFVQQQKVGCFQTDASNTNAGPLSA